MKLASLFLGLGLIFLSVVAKADFGEVDLQVRESIENHFRSLGRSVDLRSLRYDQAPKFQNGFLLIESSVWAEQRMIRPYQGWHQCQTRLQVLNRGVYRDLGSDCFFLFD